MKKILSTLSAAAMLVAAVALVGCSGAVQANPTDILEELEAPSVTVKAYPGFIRLTWDKVNGASGYKIYRDGKLLNVAGTTDNVVTGCEFYDVAGWNNNLINGIKYTYDVVALAGDDFAQAQDSNSANNNSARAVYVKQAKTTVSETANVPSVADFDEQYKDYFEKFTSEDKTFKTELVTVNGDSYIKVTAPTVPEFGYTVYTFVDNTPDYLKDSNTVLPFQIETENETAFFRPVTGSGSYNVSVKVSPVSQLYSAKEFAGSKAEVKDLNSTAITGTAKFTTTKTVRITWTPSTYNNVDFAAAEYSVFRKSAGAFTKVAGDVAEFKAGDINGSNVITTKTYYIDDTVEEGSSPIYYIVLTKDGETKGSNAITPAAVTNLNGNVTNITAAYIDTGKTARISFTPAQKTDTVGMYTVYRKLNNTTNLEKLGALKATTSTEIAGNGKVTLKDKFYVEDTIKDNKVQYTYLIYRTENNATSQNATATLPVYSIDNNALRGSITNATTAVQNNKADRLYNDVRVVFTLGDIDNSFTLYRANVTNNSNPLDSDYTVVTGYAFGATSATGREYVMFDSDLADGTYRYKLVESAKDKNDVASTRDVTVSNTNVANYNFGLVLNSTTHALEVTDSYNRVTETWANYSYSYIVVTKTYNNISGQYNYTYSDAAAVTVPATSFQDQYPASTSDSRTMKATVALPLTASAANAATTNSYQVIGIKTDSATGKKAYTITTGWVASN